MSELKPVTDNGHTVEATAFRQALTDWGCEHFRTFPWRMTRDPYLILMAEIMLHRTRVKQVLPVYERFVRRYPDKSALCRASAEELHQELASLGLRWRVDLIRAMATEIEERFNGQIPEDREGLLWQLYT